VLGDMPAERNDRRVVDEPVPAEPVAARSELASERRSPA
jgi:hypothetical protein